MNRLRSVSRAARRGVGGHARAAMALRDDARAVLDAAVNAARAPRERGMVLRSARKLNWPCWSRGNVVKRRASRAMARRRRGDHRPCSRVLARARDSVSPRPHGDDLLARRQLWLKLTDACPQMPRDGELAGAALALGHNAAPIVALGHERRLLYVGLFKCHSHEGRLIRGRANGAT